jgi:hypothetical protein
MADFCDKCGRNLSLVGRIHNCSASLISPSLLAEAARQDRLSGLVGDVANGFEPMANSMANEIRPSSLPEGAGVGARQPAEGETYKYRDAEKRRAYMKSYMSKRRKGAPLGNP